MNITVQFFASYADKLGQSTTEIPLEQGATVADLLRIILALPAASGLPPNPLVAVNLAYASPGTVLAANDEVAVIPPVAGG